MLLHGVSPLYFDSRGGVWNLCRILGLLAVSPVLTFRKQFAQFGNITTLPTGAATR